jgi:hypothetical protein
MSNEENQNVTADPVVETAPETDAPKKKRGRGGNRAVRSPSAKDWIRVIKSQGNGLDNISVKLRVNTANGWVELITVAPKQQGSPEMESPRTQVFRITDFETINDPNYNPIKAEEKAAEGATAPAEAPAETQPA